MKVAPVKSPVSCSVYEWIVVYRVDLSLNCMCCLTNHFYLSEGGREAADRTSLRFMRTKE